jgi:hypothetical protein
MDSKRKRYNVSVEGNGQIRNNVIIAYDPEGMFWIVRKLYGHLLITDDTGKSTGTISFQETYLGEGKLT